MAVAKLASQCRTSVNVNGRCTLQWCTSGSVNVDRQCTLQWCTNSFQVFAASFTARVDGRDRVPKFFRGRYVCLASSCWFSDSFLEELGNIFRQVKMRTNTPTSSTRPPWRAPSSRCDGGSEAAVAVLIQAAYAASQLCDGGG